MENFIGLLLGVLDHQLIQPRIGASKHVVQVCHIEQDAFGLARSPGSINNRQHFGILVMSGRRRVRWLPRKNRIEEGDVRGGAAGHCFVISAESFALEQQILAGSESFNMATSSSGAWREYKGTTTIPSAIIARSSATQRMLLEPSRAQRSPFLKPRAFKKSLASCTKPSNSSPDTDLTLPSRISPSTGSPALCLKRSKIFSRKVILDVIRKPTPRCTFQPICAN